MGISATERKTKQQHKRQTARQKPAVCLFLHKVKKLPQMRQPGCALSVEKQQGFVDGADTGVQGEKTTKRKRYEQSGFLAV